MVSAPCFATRALSLSLTLLVLACASAGDPSSNRVTTNPASSGASGAIASGGNDAGASATATSAGTAGNGGAALLPSAGGTAGAGIAGAGGMEPAPEPGDASFHDLTASASSLGVYATLVVTFRSSIAYQNPFDQDDINAAHRQASVHEIIQRARNELAGLAQKPLVHGVRGNWARAHHLQHRVANRAPLGLRLSSLLHTAMIRPPCHAEHVGDHVLGDALPLQLTRQLQKSLLRHPRQRNARAAARRKPCNLDHGVSYDRFNPRFSAQFV